MSKLITAAFLLSLAACANNVGEGHSKAKVEDVPAAEKAEATPEAKPEAEAATAEAKAEQPAGKPMLISTENSKISALGAKVVGEHPIDFPNFTAQALVNEGQLVGLSFEVDMATLTSDDERLTEHLKNEDFFDVPKFPTSSFTMAEAKAGAPEGSPEGTTHTIAGDFTIHGVTKRITFPAKVTISDDALEASSVFVINRQDFGIVYAGRADNLIQDDVRMTIDLKGAPEVVAAAEPAAEAQEAQQ